MKFLVLLILSMNIYASCKIDIDNLKLLTYKKMPVYDEKKGEVVQKKLNKIITKTKRAIKTKSFCFYVSVLS